MSEELATPAEMVTALRRSAMNSLGRREQSASELKQKLLQKFDEASDQQVVEVIERLTGQGLQSDQRFAEMFVRSRINKGKGPNLIRRELELQHLPSGLTEEILGEIQCDWNQSALRQLNKKYLSVDMQDFDIRAKATQFLYRRGFDSDTCAKVIDTFRNSGEES